MLIYVLLVIVFMGAPSLSYAACGGSSPNLTAASAGYTDVNDCLTAAVDGDTITVPSGSVTWTSMLVWTNKSITLKGAGINQTIIDIDNLNGTYPCMMDVTLKPTGNTPAGFTRITGFTFRATQHCGDDVPNTPDGMIRIKGDSPNFRFDHNRVESNTVAGGVVFNGYVRGVIDHNFVTSMVAATLNRKSFVCWHDSWANSTLYGHASWANPSTVGTVDQLIFEDNTFDRTGAPNGLNAFNDDYAGCRATYRFNTLENSHAATHGTETSEHIRALRHIEYYRNHTTTHPTGQDSVVKYRDGSGMTFDNTTTTNFSSVRFGALATLRREDDGSHPGGWRPWKSCGDQGTTVSVTRSGATATFTMSQNHYVPTGGAFVLVSGANQTEYNGTFFAARVDETTFTVTVTGTPATPATGTILVRSPFDGNTDTTGYPCLDQVGRGAGQLYVGTGSNMTPTTASNQVAQPLYCWNNSVAGTPLGCSAIYGDDVIIENREFYNLNTSYNGTAGIGRGLRSARPATCTAGTAYWSTDGGGNWNTSTTETYSSVPGDDGGLDLCSSTNTWTNDWYVPPTYPHALTLVGGDSGGSGGMDF